jgi:DNA modification methylase
MLTAFADPGDLAYEPFCGSGTTIIAAETHGRCCLGMEVSPGYCDVAVKRWQEFTGRTAVLADDGRTFAELAEARGTGVAA